MSRLEGLMAAASFGWCLGGALEWWVVPVWPVSGDFALTSAVLAGLL